MKAEDSRQQRTRLAAGLLGCAIEAVQARVKALSSTERENLTANIDWLVAYEAGEPR
jgi:hypothetical protein